MKRTFKQWASVLALSLISVAGVLSSAPAIAAPIATVGPINGVTCSQYSSGYGTFPTTFWDCITPAQNTSNAQAMADTVHALPANVLSVLSAKNTQLYLFANNTAFNSFSGGAATAGNLGAINAGAPSAPTVNMAAIFSTANIQGTVTSLTGYYAANTRHQVGQIYALNVASPLKSTDPFFSAAVADDSVYLSNNTGVDKPNYPSSATVWGNTIANLQQNVGKSPWEIFGLRYGSTKTFIYGYQIGRQSATATVPELNTFLQSYMSTTRNWSSQHVFGVGVQPYEVSNGILCVEHNGYNNFPLKWNACVRPYTPTVHATAALDQPHNLSAAWQTLLKNAGVKVYVFRDIDSFVAFDGRSPPTTVEVLGFSTHSAVIRSATFQDAFQTGLLPILNVSPFTGGTIMHELGHQFDNVIWGHIATANSVAVLGSVRWTNEMATDKAAFNTGTCAAKVDADRAAQVPPLDPICTLPANAGKSNWDVLATVLPMDSQEVWARTFARRAGGSMIQYYNDVQDRLSNRMLIYMNDLWSTGAPHN